MSDREATDAGSSTVPVQGVTVGDPAMWKDAMKKSATMQQVEPPKKRQKVAPSPPSVKDGDRILLIRRTISFAPLYGPSYSSVFDGLDCSERSISLDVDYNIKATDSGQGFWTPHGARPREEYPEDTHQRLLSIYLKGETHCLLAITYHVNDLSEDAQVDLKWVIEIRNDLNRPKDPVVEYQSSSTLTLKLDDQGRWSLELLVRVSVDPANEWSPRFLELSRIKYWQLFQHSLPIGKPDMKLVQRHNRAEIAKTTPITPREFYLSTHVPENTEKVPDSVQHIELNCELLPFQRRAVSWMLGREGVQFSPENPKKLVPLTNHFQTSLPPTFFDQKDMNGQTCYASHIMGIVTKDLEGLRRSFESDQISRSGVLAEEMGLGKTVELTALICLHRRETGIGEIIADGYHGRDVTGSGSTLIITPPSILSQWQSEIAKHAPGLRVFTYKGVKKSTQEETEELVENLMQYDVVLTTYNVLSSEIHFTKQAPQRSLRGKKVYKAKRSPLVDISWWRVCLDEAQMIEGGVSNAAVVAREIPRVNAWCVTGTPVRKEIDDLYGLLLFLRYEPFCQKEVWKRMISYNHEAFKSLFGYLALRHSKDIVGDQTNLPPQHRVVVTIPFSQVEEQNYQNLFDQMCEDIGVDSTGEPIDTMDWKLDHHIDRMRAWLVRLRQTCLHPEAGERNRKAFGHRNGSLRTVEEVLGVMIEQLGVQMRADERALFGSMIKRGQVYEHRGGIEDAMEAWRNALIRTKASVSECREALTCEIEKAKDATNVPAGNVKAKYTDSDPEGDEPEDEEDVMAEKKSGRVTAARNKLKSFLELEHACYFWLGTGYFQLRERSLGEDKEEEVLKGYKKEEEDHYEFARKLRLELMSETRAKATRYISTIEKKKQDDYLVEVPDIDPPEEGSGGIETQTILDGIIELAGVLNEQVIVFDDWRSKLVDLLQEPLVDSEGDKELRGDEVEVSVERQEESYAYMSALRALLADREQSLTEVQNTLIQKDTEIALHRPGKIHTSLFTKLIAEKSRVDPLDGHKSMKRMLSELRTLINNLKQSEEGGGNRVALERGIAEGEYKKLQKMMIAQTKACENAFKELEQFRGASNSRMDFYRQVQAISDTLLSLDFQKEFGTKEVNEKTVKNLVAQENTLEKKITTAKSRLRYLTTLSGKKVEERPTCQICLEVYEIGIISNCGHSFCKECTLIWRKTAANCPFCKAHLRPKDFFQVTYSPKDLAMKKEQAGPKGSIPGGKRIYEDVDDQMLREIKSINLENSYGSKIDMITRHLTWLQRNEPGFKAVVFSQWSDVLEVVKESLSRAEVGFASLEKDGLSKFKHDPDVSCFLLHAKSQSAGLTLVNATHVFLCEPLLNVGLELQAVSRVHRIGQQRATTVWLYVVNNTVEQSVLELATRRRMAFIGQNNDEDTPMSDAESSQLLDEKLEAAESDELREGLGKLIEKSPGGGELVDTKDLWDCLFTRTDAGSGAPKVNHLLVRRELALNAAEQRLARPGLVEVEKAPGR